MKECKVSVVVPVYNATDYLRACLDSLLAQNLENSEFILVDDGSVDDSWEIMNEYVRKDKRFRCIRQENQGAAGARNCGIKACAGKYVAFVDADDWIDVRMLEEQYRFADEHDADIVYTGITSHKRDGSLHCEEHKFGVIDGKKNIVDFLLKPSTLYTNSPVAKLYKSDLLKKHNILFEKLRIGEDALFNCDCLKHARRLYVLPGCYYHYRRNDVSVTSRFNEYFIEDSALFFQRKQDFFYDDMECGNRADVANFLEEERSFYYLFAIYSMYRTPEMFRKERMKWLQIIFEQSQWMTADITARHFTTGVPKMVSVLYKYKKYSWMDCLLFVCFSLQSLINKKKK